MAGQQKSYYAKLSYVKLYLHICRRQTQQSDPINLGILLYYRGECPSECQTVSMCISHITTVCVNPIPLHGAFIPTRPRMDFNPFNEVMYPIEFSVSNQKYHKHPFTFTYSSQGSDSPQCNSQACQVIVKYDRQVLTTDRNTVYLLDNNYDYRKYFHNCKALPPNETYICCWPFCSQFIGGSNPRLKPYTKPDICMWLKEKSLFTSWTNANKLCTNDGGHLVVVRNRTVLNAAEIVLLDGFIPNPLFIGLQYYVS